ncbi:UNVERIFIED_CONTAM: Retrovirus-related Pol polyprotein from transposon TNT 1-94, partial [Sesamum indicum]
KDYNLQGWARGKRYTQRPGFDFEETYSPVDMTKSIQILLAIGTRSDYEISNMDVKTTFQNGFIEEEIYIVPLKGFTSHEKKRRPIVSKCPSIASNKLSKAGTHVLMKSYG